MKKLITILVIVWMEVVKCDLPVHCIAREIHGQWNIIASENLVNITKQDCGHLTPDKNTDHVNNDIYKQQLLNRSIIQVELQFPDSVLHHSQKIGRWSMIYDEGFEIRLFNGKIFFGFFKYNTTNNKVADDKDDEQSEGYNSECNETFLGWVYDSKKNDNWGCFYAQKINSVQEQKEYEQIQQMEQKMFDINRQIEQTENNDSIDTQQLQQQYLAQLYQDNLQKSNMQVQDISLNQKINSSEGMDMESQLKLINEDFMKTNNLNQISNSNIDTINTLNQMVFNNFKQIDQINNNVKQQQLFESKVNMMNINPVGGINTVNQASNIADSNTVSPSIIDTDQTAIEQANQINKIDQLSQINKMEQMGQINKIEQFKNSMNQFNNGSYYDRLVKKQKLYDLPHQNFFSSFLENSEETYEPDYDFMNMINNQSLPWKAKIHSHFLNKTNQHMMNLIGLTRFKQIKQSQHIQKQYKQSSSFLQLASNFKLAANLQNKMRIKDKLIVNMRLKNKNRQKNRQDETQLSEFEQKLQQYLSTDNQIQKDYTSQIENQIFMEPCDPNKPDIEYSGSKIPRCYDWRNANGTNYDTMISHQGDCGSCYVISALSALESRIRIKTGKIVKLSKSGPLSCTIYNQGCNGGYPELVYKYGMENGFYEDICDIQKEYITDTQCNMDYCKQNHKESIWKISNYGYVSTDKNHSYYGNTNELAMMKEIYNNGPVVIALNASPDLYYYSSGVFVTNPKNPLQENNLVDNSQNYQISSWMFTNHAVVCVGWGETIHEGQMLKYWILKNSWGEQWGENGYFKILRGHNLAAVENQAVFGDI